MVATALFGGSFDPIHLGHLHLIHAVYSATRYRKFILVPVATNNFKRDILPSSSKDRLSMIEIAIEEYTKIYPQDKDIEFQIEDCEIKRGGVSYTYDTVKTIYENYQIDGKLGLVMGDDLIPTLKRWYHFDDLIKLVDLVVCRREEKETIIPPGLDFQYVSNNIFVDASSTIRSLAEGNKDFSYLLTAGVYEYVKRRNLYKS